MTRLLVEADGGSRGNPGPAGYGAVVKDADTGTVLAEVAESIGKATNNVAEYGGLVAGLRAASEVDPSADVEVRMDSKLVVEQMRGNWQVKHPDLRPLASEAAGLARSFGSVSYDWVPRDRNKHADRLANEAMDAATGSTPRRKVRAVDDEPAGDAERRRAFVPPSLGTPTRTLLLRHGATAASTGGWMNGSGDEPLTDAGRDEARAVARALAGQRVDAIVCSPLACGMVLVDVLAPEGTVTEAFAWVVTAFGTGYAAGSAIAGVVLDSSGYPLAILVAVGGGLLGAALVRARLTSPAVASGLRRG